MTTDAPAAADENGAAADGQPKAEGGDAGAGSFSLFVVIMISFILVVLPFVQGF
jgi:hypothetical protein